MAGADTLTIPESGPSPGDAERRLAELSQIPHDLLEAMNYRMLWVDRQSRPDQLPPDLKDLTWFTWLQLGGRGSGKTRTGAECVWDMAFKHPGCRIAVVAPTSSDVRKTCFEGESGLLARVPPSLVLNYNRQELCLTLTNGSQIFGFSADEPDRLRGPQHHFAWADELAAWRYLDDALDNLLMGLRLGSAPRMIATTTPRPIKRLKEIIADSTTKVDRVSTYANRDNLPSHFIHTILKRYEGTRLGRQELYAELIDDVPGALWQRAQLDQHRCKPDPKTQKVVLPDMEVLVIGFDPSISSEKGADETGIVAVGRGTDKIGYVFRDESMQGTPDQCARAAIALYDELKAGAIIYEANQGGEHVGNTLTATARAMKAEGKRNTDFVAIRPVWASRGKVTRAEPVSALYEQGRVKHVGMFSKLEDQMCEFTSDFDRKEMGYSPDRVDALVWAVTDVLVEQVASHGLLEWMRLKSDAKRALTDPRQAKVTKTFLMIPPPGTNMAFGKTGKRYVLRGDGLMDIDEEDHIGLLGAGFRLKQMEATS